MSIDKKAALDRLASLEDEAKKLRSIIEKADEPKTIFERVQSFEDACVVMKVDIAEFVRKFGFLAKDTLAYEKLKVIAEALREGWKPNWNNSNQPKRYPWFDMRGAVSFVSVVTYWGDTCSVVGSRLCQETEKKAEYMGKQFIDLYRDLLSE